jgi:hypothetical protein
MFTAEEVLIKLFGLKYRLLKDVLMTPWGDSSEMSLFTSIPEDLGFNHAEILKKLV